MRCAPTDSLERAWVLPLDLPLHEEGMPVERERATASTFILSSLLTLASLLVAYQASDTMPRSDAGHLDGQWVFHRRHGYICFRQTEGIRRASPPTLAGPHSSVQGL